MNLEKTVILYKSSNYNLGLYNMHLNDIVKDYFLVFSYILPENENTMIAFKNYEKLSFLI